MPEQSLLYTVEGRAKAGNLALLDREMQAICASFHVEKIAVPAVQSQRKQKKKQAKSQAHWAYQAIVEDDD